MRISRIWGFSRLDFGNFLSEKRKPRNIRLSDRDRHLTSHFTSLEEEEEEKVDMW